MRHRAFVAEQIDRLEHVVEVVRGLAHAHEHHLVHRPAPARERHLRHDLGAAELALQAAAAAHAEHAAHRATHLRRDAQPVARQQHALHRLGIGQLDEQARRAVTRRMLGAQACEAGELGGERRQRLAQRERQKGLDAAAPARLRPGLRPQAQHAPLMLGAGPEGAQALADGFDQHGRMEGRLSRLARNAPESMAAA